MAEAEHIVMEGILDTQTVFGLVPDETDSWGNERLTTSLVPVRHMRNEFFKFGRQIADDPAFKEKVIILLKYDPRPISLSAFEPQYRRKGGNVYTYLYKVGAGMTSYIPAGHENDELLDANTGFDGGAGDFHRYVAQTLFFLAGYDTTACDASCNGLPIVDGQNRLHRPLRTGPGDVFPPSPILFDSRKPGFSSPFRGRYEARLLDIGGRVIEGKQGTGEAYHEFNTRGLPSGIYILSVQFGSQPARTKRYLL